jgi:hypothetical protein
MQTNSATNAVGLATIYPVDLSASATVKLPAGTTIGGSSLTALGTITSSSNKALAVGLNGLTNPAFNVDSSTALQADGINVKGLDAGNGAQVKVITSGTNAPLAIDAAGSGTITIGGTSTGAVTITPATTITGIATFTAIPVFSAGIPSNSILRTITDSAAAGATVVITAAQSGQTFNNASSSGSPSWTLPTAANGLWFTFTVSNVTAGFTVTGGTMKVKTSAAGTTLSGTTLTNTQGTAVVNDTITLNCDGTVWRMVAQSGIFACA